MDPAQRQIGMMAWDLLGIPAVNPFSSWRIDLPRFDGRIRVP
jgi:hypothetical protein